jgi:subtilisin
MAFAAAFLGAITAIATLGPNPASAAAAQDSIVMLRSTDDPADVAAGLGLKPDAIWPAIHGFSASLSTEQAELLRSDPRVVSVTVNRGFRRNAGVVSGYSIFSSQVTPTGVARVGGTQSATADIDKRDDVRVDADVAIIDTGVQSTHPDLNVVGGVDCSGSGSFEDGRGHGTFAAGTIGAIDNKIGVVGIAPGARIWSVRVFDASGNATLQTVLCGMDWVVEHSGTIDVANMSFENEWADRGGTCASPRGDPVLTATCAMIGAGVTAVAAAGNDSADANGFQPAGFPGVITASALVDYNGSPGGKAKPTCADYGADDSFAAFSNYGSSIEIAAPGACLVSTYVDGYATWWGTSFSSSYTSGAVALYKSTHATATPEQVTAALLATAEPGPLPGDPDTYPEGVLNVATF